MVDITKHAEYWKSGALDDWDTARQLLSSVKIRHGLFFVHLALEKVIKGLLCLNSKDIAPRTHNLIRLADMAGLDLMEEHIDTLADINQFNMEGRYPDIGIPPPSPEEASAYMKKAQEVFHCLIKQY